MPIYKGKQGNPVLWSRRFFAELSCIEGDVGGRHIIGKNQDVVAMCEIDSEGIHRDVDTISQLKSFKVTKKQQ